MKKRIRIFTWLLFAAGISMQAQDIHFSMFSETPMHLNPAYTGMFNGLFRVSANYRNQWKSIGSPYTTMAASFDMPIPVGFGQLGVGAFLYQDKAGDSKFGTFQGLLSASALVPISGNATFSAGLQGGIGQRSATITTLQWENQYQNGAYDPTLPANESNLLTSFIYPDFSAGLAYHYKSIAENITSREYWKIDIGAAYMHANRPTMKFYSGSEKLNARIVGHVKAHYDFPGTKWALQPAAVYMKQGPAQEITVGTMLRYKLKNGTKVTSLLMESGVALGAHYRVGDAIIPQLYYDLGDMFIGLGYDLNVSSLKDASRMNGGFEITMRYSNLNSALFKNKRPIR